MEKAIYLNMDQKNHRKSLYLTKYWPVFSDLYRLKAIRNPIFQSQNFQQVFLGDGLRNICISKWIQDLLLSFFYTLFYRHESTINEGM